MSSPEFPTWLQIELNKRHWAQIDLVRRSHVSPSTVSKILSGQRGIGNDTCKAFAQALEMPHKEVLIAAGLYQDEKQRSIYDKNAPFRWSELSTDQKEEVELFIKVIMERDNQRKMKYKQSRKREGAAPPETIKE